MDIYLNNRAKLCSFTCSHYPESFNCHRCCILRDIPGIDPEIFNHSHSGFHLKAPLLVCHGYAFYATGIIVSIKISLYISAGALHLVILNVFYCYFLFLSSFLNRLLNRLCRCSFRLCILCKISSCLYRNAHAKTFSLCSTGHNTSH